MVENRRLKGNFQEFMELNQFPFDTQVRFGVCNFNGVNDDNDDDYYDDNDDGDNVVVLKSKECKEI